MGVLIFPSPPSPTPASPYAYFNLPIQTMKAGALGTHNSLGVAKANNARFLLASTSEIYGDPTEHPQQETYSANVDVTPPLALYYDATPSARSLPLRHHLHHTVD